MFVLQTGVPKMSTRSVFPLSWKNCKITGWWQWNLWNDISGMSSFQSNTAWQSHFFFQFGSGLRWIKLTLFIPDEVGLTFIARGRSRVVSLKNLLVDDTIYCWNGSEALQAFGLWKKGFAFSKSSTDLNHFFLMVDQREKKWWAFYVMFGQIT